VWLSSTKPSQEWCPVGRTLDVQDSPEAKGRLQIVGCSVDAHAALVATSDDRLRLWDLQTGTCTKTLYEPDSSTNGPGLRDCHLVRGGKQAVSCGLGVSMWDVATGQMRKSPELKGDVNCCDASLDGTKVLFGSADCTVNIWNLGSTADKELATYAGHTGEVNECCFFDNDRKFLSCSKDKTLRIWELGDPNATLELPGHDDTVLCCDVCPGGEQAVSCSGDRTVKLWNIKQTAHEMELAAELRVATDTVRAKEVKQKLYAITTRRCLKTLPFLDAKPTACRVFPDGVRLLVIRERASPQIYNLDTSECMQSLLGHGGTINCCHLYDEGAKAITCASKIRVWDVSSRGKPHQLGLPDSDNMHSSVVKELRISPGKVVARTLLVTLQRPAIRVALSHASFALCFLSFHRRAQSSLLRIRRLTSNLEPRNCFHHHDFCRQPWRPGV
jgi:WD40 repeat protein